MTALQSEPSSLHKHAKLTQTQRCGKASAVVIVVANIVVVVVVVFVCLYVALSACVVVVVDATVVVVFVVVVAVDCGWYIQFNDLAVDHQPRRSGPKRLDSKRCGTALIYQD